MKNLMTERESNDFGWFILTLVALVGGIVMGIMLEGTIRTDTKLKERTIECVTQPQKCKVRYDYYQLEIKK
jgi:uncharacterized membrane-anchored protein YhcB (DUF1043 family)